MRLKLIISSLLLSSINSTYSLHRKLGHQEELEVMDKDCFFWIALTLEVMVDLNNSLFDLNLIYAHYSLFDV